MMRSSRVVFGFVLAIGLTFALVGAAGAKGAKKTKPPSEDSAAPVPTRATPNACGCYRKGNGCVCTSKKGKCECPGECEPIRCEEKRNQEMEKEEADVVRRAQEDDKRREEAEAKRAQDQVKKRQADEAAESAQQERKERDGGKEGKP